MGFFSTIRTLLYREIRLELNTGQLVGSMLFFALLAGILFSMVFTAGLDETDYFPGVYTFSHLFAILLILNRAIARERENGCLELIMLAGSSREAVMISRITANYLFFILISIFITPVFLLLFDLHIPPAGILQLALVILIFQAGLAVTGSILAFLVSYTRLGNLLLPVLLLPLLIPLLLGTVESISLALGGTWNQSFTFWLLLMLTYDLVYFTAAVWLSPYLLEV
ncbi:heme exporter protein CcmB [Halarsenatibacter silvermanii]|uniref:Heme exporter protein B n=1 Tax=Halarsenatibacter silvermanii TaxID=321763 RepID=A0A1G9SI89_9FIRM|nr:heme exporter protein CcmB [Halarsenatibacter silvermanii]SDM35218.1 heme exporter protein B [Halarsenatibacter silvermanii]